MKKGKGLPQPEIAAFIWFATIIAMAILLSSCETQTYRTVSYSAETLQTDFKFRYLGSKGDTNAVNVRGKKVEVMEMTFYEGQIAWCSVDSDSNQMAKCAISIDEKVKTTNGLAKNLEIYQIVE